MESYAIVQASGKQFWVEEDKFYDLDKLPLDRGDSFSLNQITCSLKTARFFLFNLIYYF